jgi:hypothetical protein
MPILVIGAIMVVVAAIVPWLESKFPTLNIDYELPVNFDGKPITIIFLLGVTGIFVLGAGLAFLAFRRLK